MISWRSYISPIWAAVWHCDCPQRSCITLISHSRLTGLNLCHRWGSIIWGRTSIPAITPTMKAKLFAKNSYYARMISIPYLLFPRKRQPRIKGAERVIQTVPGSILFISLGYCKVHSTEGWSAPKLHSLCQSIQADKTDQEDRCRYIVAVLLFKVRGVQNLQVRILLSSKKSP